MYILFFALLPLFALSLCLAVEPDGAFYTIIVKSDCNGSCHQEGYNSTTRLCCFLEDAIDLLESNTQLIIEKHTNTLRTSLRIITNMSHVYIRGIRHSVTIYCNGLSSVGFDSLFKLRLENLTFVGCGSLEKNNGHRLSTDAAVVIRSSSGISMKNVAIKYSTGLGLLLSGVTGNVQIESSNFIGNPRHKVSHSYKTFGIKGGGMKIIIKNAKALASYVITDSSFRGNLESFTSRADRNYRKGHGGGLKIFVSGTQVAQSFVIEDCIFTGNKAENGGGIAIQVRNSSNYFVFVKHSSFYRNAALNSMISNGGGMQISLFGSLESNTFLITGCNFTDNIAYFGGGLSIVTQYTSHGNEMNVSNSIWNGNKAASGSAVDIISHHSSGGLQLSKSMVTPVFHNCTFVRNFVTHFRNITRNSFEVGYGTLSVIEVNVEFHSSVLFDRNIGPALIATMSTIHFRSCSALFRNNIGTFGGAVSLNFASLMLHPPGTVMNFTGNKATKYGGAVYSFITNDHMLFSKSFCPFLFDCDRPNSSDCHVSISFTRNKASRGNSLFLPSLLPCRIAYSSETDDLINPIDVFKQELFKFHNSTIKRQIATAPSLARPSHKWISVFPGERCYLNVTLTDELGASIVSSLAAFYAVSISTKPSNGSIPVTLEDTAYIYNGTFTLLGPENVTAYIHFETLTRPLIHISRTVRLKFCSPGYYYSKALRKCICSKRYYYGILQCRRFRAYIVRGAWCGYVNNSRGVRVFVSGPCSFFCHIKGKSWQVIPRHYENRNKDYFCKENRHGILCGECKLGYTTYYHSSSHYNCLPTHKYCVLYGWMIFVIAEILPITLVFIVIIATGLDVTSGYIQGFLLYSHILCSLTISRANHLTSTEYYFYWNFVHVLYFPLNLKFFYLRNTAFCISNNATSLDIAALGYIKGLYCVALIFTVVFFLRCFSRCCQCCNRFLRFTTAKNSALIGMSALFVLFFTSAVEISLLILQPAPLYQEYFEIQSYRVALYGEKMYFGPEHLQYAIPAIVFLTILFTPTTMLLFYPLVSLLLSCFNVDASQSWIGCVLTKGFMYEQLKPFYDRFYASFQDKHRYFAGMYFVYRIIVQLCYYVPNYIESEFVMETLLIIFLLLHTIVQPYQERLHNIIDALLLSNLVVINGITCVNSVVLYNSVHTHFWNVWVASNCQIYFAISPMIVSLFYLAWKYILRFLWKKLKLTCILSNAYELLQSDLLEHNRLASTEED